MMDTTQKKFNTPLHKSQIQTLVMIVFFMYILTPNLIAKENRKRVFSGIYLKGKTICKASPSKMVFYFTCGEKGRKERFFFQHREEDGSSVFSTDNMSGKNNTIIMDHNFDKGYYHDRSGLKTILKKVHMHKKNQDKK